MVTGLTETLTEGQLVDKDATLGKIPSLESVVSSVDDEDDEVDCVPVEKREAEVVVNETRDDYTPATCLTDNLCAGGGNLCGNPNLLRQEGEQVDRETTVVNTFDVATTDDKGKTAVLNQAVGLEEGAPQNGVATESRDAAASNEQDDAYFSTWCSHPGSLFDKDAKNATRSSSEKGLVGTTNEGNGEDESITSLTLGKMFDDLSSLPSLSKFQTPWSGKEDEDETESALSLGDFSAMSESIKGIPPLESSSSVEMEDGTVYTLDSTVMDQEIEMKLSGVNLEGQINDVVDSSGTLGEQKATVSDKESKGQARPVESKRRELEKELQAARDDFGYYHINCAKIATTVADLLCEEGDYEKALLLYTEASSIYTTKLGDFQETSVESKLRVGETLEALGRYDEAIHTYYYVLEVRKAMNGETDPSVPDALTLIARALKKKGGRHQQALKELKRALKLYRASLGDSHPKVSSCVDEIADMYLLIGNSAKAALILDEVVKLKAATNGMYNRDVASSLTHLGIAQHTSGDAVNALKSLKKAYSIYVALDGEHNKDAIMALEHIARVCRETGDHKKSISAYTAVLKGKKKILSSTDPSLVDTYADLGICLRESGDYDKAAKCLKQALSICLADGKNLREVGVIAQVMHELGIVHQLRGNAKDAVKVFKQELSIRRKMGRSERRQVARTLFYLGTAKYDLGEYQAALSFLTEALSIYEKLDDDLGLDFAETLFSAGLVFQNTKNVERAHDAFCESLKLFHVHGLGKDHELVKMATAKLKELGHKCQCGEGKNCKQVPCKSSFGPADC